MSTGGVVAGGLIILGVSEVMHDSDIPHEGCLAGSCVLHYEVIAELSRGFRVRLKQDGEIWREWAAD
jgi:hypothetical protein